MKRADVLADYGLVRPGYEFSSDTTNLFLTGATLTGKSGIATLLAARISGCSVQNMDLFRTWAQDREAQKPKEDRNPFVRFGSCDSFHFVGDGSYSPESLVTGFNEYAKAIAAPLKDILPRLDVQGARHVLFEGVQLTPEITLQYLEGDNRLIVVTASEQAIADRRKRIYGRSRKMMERYGLERILLTQSEILRQADNLEPEKLIKVDNSDDYMLATAAILEQLIGRGVIRTV